MYPKLDELLSQCSANKYIKQNEYNIMSSYGLCDEDNKPKNYSIRQDKIEDFFKSYCDYTYNNLKSFYNDEDFKNFENNNEEQLDDEDIDPKINLNLYEKAGDICPIVCDMILSFQTSVNTNVITDKFLIAITRKLQLIIMENFIMDNDMIELICCVLKTPDPWFIKSGKIMEFRIRFQFPFCTIKTELIGKLIKPILISELENSDVFGLLSTVPVVTTWKKILKNFGSENILMYGSEEKLDRPKMVFHKIWNDNDLRIFDKVKSYNAEPKNSLSLYSSFSPIHHSFCVEGFINKKMFYNVQYNKPKEDDFHSNEDDDSNMNKYYWLPIFLSIHYNKYKVDRKQKLHLIESEEMNNDGDFSEYLDLVELNPDDDFLSDMDICEQLIVLLDSNRFLEFQSWLPIVKAIYKSDDGGDRGLELLINITQNVFNNVENKPKFVTDHNSIRDLCERYYVYDQRNFITVKTIATFASDDNPVLFSAWNKKRCKNFMIRAISTLSDYDISILFYNMYWTEFVCAKHSTKEWYYFTESGWRETPHGTQVMKTFVESFRLRILQFKSELNSKINNIRDDAIKKKFFDLDKNIPLLDELLKKEKKLTTLTKFVSIYFEDLDFPHKLDSNPYLTGMKNGVIEVSGECVYFRDYKPEDFISRNTNIKYETYSWDHKIVLELFDWLRKVFPEDNLLHYFLKYEASGLIGQNIDKYAFLFSGDGHNSKSAIIKLKQAAWGNYCVDLPTETFCGKDGEAGGTSSHLARTKGARWAFVAEPSKEQKFRLDKIKKYTGGDTFYVRKLQKEGEDIKTTFKLNISCNVPPKFNAVDEATIDRIRFIAFISKWVMDPPETIEEQFAQLRFLMDKDFDDKIPRYAGAYFWVICEYYSLYIRERLVDIPEIITQTINNFWMSGDIYECFIKRFVEIIYLDDEKTKLNNKARVSENEMYNAFRDWYTKSFNKSISSMPDLIQFITEFNKRWSCSKGGYWRGIALKDPSKEEVVENEEEEEEEQPENKNMINNEALGKLDMTNLNISSSVGLFLNKYTSKEPRIHNKKLKKLKKL